MRAVREKWRILTMKISRCHRVAVIEKRAEPDQTIHFCRRCFQPCDVIDWESPLTPHEEWIIVQRYFYGSKKKRAIRSLAKTLGKSAPRIYQQERRAAMKILDMNDSRYELLKKGLYEALKAEQSDNRAQWKDIFIEQYERKNS